MASPHLTGIVPRLHHLEWTCLTPGKRKVSVAHRSPAEPAAGDSFDLTAALLNARGHLLGELHFAIPLDAALLHVADLPSLDDSEISGMVQLMVEDLTPYPVDRTYVSWERLAQSETDSRVLIALTAQGTVDPLNQAFRSAKRLLHRVDVDVMGWWRNLQRNGGVNEQGVQLLLIADGAQTHLIISHRGVPVLFRALGDPAALRPDLLNEDLGTALASLETERGLTEVDGITVWHWGSAPAFLSALTREAGWEVPLRTANLATLPSLSEGLALRALESGARALDLSPPTWKEAEVQRRLRQNVLVGLGAAAALWLIAMAVLLGLVSLRDRQVRRLAQQVQRLEPRVAEVDVLAQRVQSLSQFTDRTYSALECLREVAVHMPVNGLTVTDFTFRKSSGTVTLQGIVRDPQRDFYPFVEGLSASALLNVDKFDSKKTRLGNEFSVRAVLPEDRS